MTESLCSIVPDHPSIFLSDPFLIGLPDLEFRTTDTDPKEIFTDPEHWDCLGHYVERNVEPTQVPVHLKKMAYLMSKFF